MHTIIDVTPSGIFSNTNMITANKRNNNVMVDGLICFPPIRLKFELQKDLSAAPLGFLVTLLYKLYGSLYIY